jgi:hypothetical protein
LRFNIKLAYMDIYISRGRLRLGGHRETDVNRLKLAKLIHIEMHMIDNIHVSVILLRAH